jgi:hypothetical protein
MSSAERLSEVVSTRFAPSEIAEFRRIAGDKPISQVVRDLALKGVQYHSTRQIIGIGSSFSSSGTRKSFVSLTGNFSGLANRGTFTRMS